MNHKWKQFHTTGFVFWVPILHIKCIQYQTLHIWTDDCSRLFYRLWTNDLNLVLKKLNSGWNLKLSLNKPKFQFNKHEIIQIWITTCLLTGPPESTILKYSPEKGREYLWSQDNYICAYMIKRFLKFKKNQSINEKIT